MLSGIGIWQLLIVLVIVLLLFGTKRLKGLGGDLGSAIKGFKKAITDDKNEEKTPEEQTKDQQRVETEALTPKQTEEKQSQAPTGEPTAAEIKPETKQ